MIFRILFLCLCTLLAGCGPKDENAKSSIANSAATAKQVSLTTYSVMDSVSLGKFFELIDTNGIYSERIRKVLEDVDKLAIKVNDSNDKLDTLNHEIFYRVCFSDIDGFVVKHPCSLDSALLVSIAKKLNFSDSVKALKVELDLISYSTSSEFADYSGMYLNDDGTIESSCLSKDGKKCNNLYAHISVSKKLFPENILTEFAQNWPRETFDVHIDESNFAEKFKIDDFLSSIYEVRLERRYHMPQRKHQMNQKDSLIPFEMCYENGIAIPCNLAQRDRSRIKNAIEKEGDTLVAVTYQRCFMVNDFALDGMSSKHFCNSKDGAHCSELFALVRRNDNAEVKRGSLVLYRFDLKDFSYTIEELSHGDPMWIRYNELHKKDGTYVGHEKTHR